MCVSQNVLGIESFRRVQPINRFFSCFVDQRKVEKRDSMLKVAAVTLHFENVLVLDVSVSLRISSFWCLSFLYAVCDVGVDEPHAVSVAISLKTYIWYLYILYVNVSDKILVQPVSMSWCKLFSCIVDERKVEKCSNSWNCHSSFKNDLV